jgi:YkoY family integral membrane protein
LNSIALVDHDTRGTFGPYCASIVFVDFEAADLLTILLLIILEGLLSADNALVMAVMIMGLPREQQNRALKYGLIGAFVFRIAATLLATMLIRVAVVKLGGGLYLLYLTYGHFRAGRSEESRRHPPEAKPAFGLSAFWVTVVRVELVNLAFSIDSILAAVAMSPKTWVVVVGGLLGIVALRLVVGQLIELIRRYPALVDGAFIIIAWVGIKLLSEYAHQLHWIPWEIPRWFSLGLIILIFVVSYLYARRKGPAA